MNVEISYFELLKELCSCFVKSDGTYRGIPKGVWGRRELSEDKIEFIYDLLDLNLKTNANKEETKYYILNLSSTMKDTMDWYNRKYETNINFDAIRNRLSRDREKRCQEIPLEILAKLFYNNESLLEYQPMVKSLIMRYGNRRDMNKGTPLDLSANKVRTSLSDERFNQGIKMIAPFTYGNIEKFSSGIPIEFKEYFNYLNTAVRLDQAELERYKVLKSLLGVGVKEVSTPRIEDKKVSRVPNIVI